MCLCSELQNARPKNCNEQADKTKLLGNLQKVLTLAYELVESKELKGQLPFILTVKKSSQLESERRTSKIFTYDRCEYATTALLDDNWKRWDEDPLSFWVQFQGHEISTFDDPQYQVLSACLRVEKSDAHSRILRRFYTVILYRIRASRPQNDNAETIAGVFHDLLHPNDSGSEETLRALTDSVKDIIQAGARYDNIAHRLGIGSLFLLGQQIARTTWERWLPKQGPLFEKAMLHLTEKGIVHSGKKYEPLASKVITNLVNRLPNAAWVVEHVTTTAESHKRRCSSPEPSAKHQRRTVHERYNQHQTLSRDSSTGTTSLHSLYANSDSSRGQIEHEILQSTQENFNGNSDLGYSQVTDYWMTVVGPDMLTAAVAQTPYSPSQGILEDLSSEGLASVLGCTTDIDDTTMIESGCLSREERTVFEQICFLGPKFPRLVLHLGDQKRQHWDSSGEKVDRLDDGIPSYIGLNRSEFVDILIQKNLISLENNMLSVQSNVTPKSLILDEARYQLVALQLASRWFPYEHEPLYGERGRSLLPLMQTVIKYIRPLTDKRKIYDALRFEVVETLLSASRFGDLEWKQLSIGLAMEMIGQPEDPEWAYLSRWANQRHICVHNIPTDESSLFQPADPRENAQLGDIIIRISSDYILQNKLDCALNTVERWAPFAGEPSTLEKPVVQRKELLIARIYHVKGNFLTAKGLYKRLAATMERWESTTACTLTSRLADACIELGNYDEAAAQCQSNLDFWESQGWEYPPKAYCIRLSLADAWLHQGKFSKAEETYKSLIVRLECHGGLRRSAAMNSMRALFGLARTAHAQCNWEEAYLRWREMMTRIATDSSWKGDFTELVICSSLSVVCKKLNLSAEAHEHATRAYNLRNTVKDQFWCPRLHKWAEDTFHDSQLQ